MPNDIRKHFIKAFSDATKELEREVAELYDEINSEPQESEDKE